MPIRTRWSIPLLLLVALGVFLPGINWGLPAGRDVTDPFLFGDHPRWAGAEIMKLAGPTDDPNRGADVASHPGADRNNLVIVNQTDADRARIIRRYRLMSYQPDEWNTLKALSEMKPGAGNFDPKLYQYGGLWVYPVGAMVKAAALLHLIDLRSDVAWYLDHPEAFGRFYVVARLWSVVWGLVGVWAMYAIVSRIVGGWVYPTLAGGGFILMPVVINMAHEAKPHLAGAVLMLLAVLAAARYVERGRVRDWLLAGGLCGAAIGMVLSTMPILLIPPAMVLLRKSDWRQKLMPCLGALAVAGLVYPLSNPYVPINFFLNRAILQSNLGNSSAMYHPSLTFIGITNTAYLIAAGTSPLLAVVGVVGAVVLGRRAVRVRNSDEPAEIRRRTTGLLLAVPTLCVLGQCAIVAMGKPGEFGRFLLLPDVFLLVEAVVFMGTGWRRWHPTSGVSQAIAVLLFLTVAIPGLGYLRAFVRDGTMPTSRLGQAVKLQVLTEGGKRGLAIWAEPAPYCLPPVNVFDGPIVLLPKDGDSRLAGNLAKICVLVEDAPGNSWFWSLWTATPISWADKPLQVREVSPYNRRSSS